MTQTKFFHPDQLTAIRETCDWRKLLADLGVRADVKRCTDTEFWGYSPFSPNEKTASFHMKAPGLWYCWSSHVSAPGRSKPGGGVIELVQAVHASRGQIMKLNEAASWIVDHGHARVEEQARKAISSEEKKENTPITIDLTPRLSPHPAFTERGISDEICRYLRCGYLPDKRGMLAERLVFQVGGASDDGKRTILSHVGRATTPEQEEKGKWRFYRGFNPSLELYNQDSLLLDQGVIRQIRETGHIVLVEGAFDVAKCVEAGIKNVVGSFGARLSAEQAVKLKDILSRAGGSRIVVFYDRDKAGQKACADAMELFGEYGIEATAFDWSQSWNGKTIPEDIQDPCDLGVEQLVWLKRQWI